MLDIYYADSCMAIIPASPDGLEFARSIDLDTRPS